MSPVAETDQSAAVRYEALIRISDSIRARKEPHDLFEILVDELRQVIRFDAIAQFDESANKIYWHLEPTCQCREDRPTDAEDGESLPHFVYRTQETVLLGTLEGELRFPSFTRKMQRNGLQSMCVFPLTTAHRRLGSLLLGSIHPNAYSPEEVRFCALVADQIALATDDAINFQASQKAQERLELLLDLTNRVVSNLNLRDVLREISAQVRRVMHCRVPRMVSFASMPWIIPAPWRRLKKATSLRPTIRRGR
jgi:formate hydrogenlyase transcriptional activator